VKAVTDAIYSVFTVCSDSTVRHVYMVSPGKLGSVLDISLWKDVDRKAARLITVENTAYEESLKDLKHVV